MKKLLLAAGAVLSLALINGDVEAQDTGKTLGDYLGEDYDYFARSYEVDYVFSLLEDAEKVEDTDLEEMIAPMEDAETYFNFLMVSLAINDETSQEMLMNDTNYSIAFVHEREDYLEIDMYSADAEGNILAPSGYANTETGEVFLYDAESDAFVDYADQHSAEDLLYVRYGVVRDYVIELEENVEVYETDEHYIIGTYGQDQEVADKINETVEITFDGTTEDSLNYGTITLLDKESGLILYNIILATATNEEGSQRISSEFYSYFAEHNEYADLQDVNERFGEDSSEEEDGGGLDSEDIDLDTGEEESEEDSAEDDVEEDVEDEEDSEE